MVIERVETCARTLPLAEPQRMGTGSLTDGIRNVFVRVTDDSGRRGHGEASAWTIFSDQTWEGTRSAIDTVLAPLLVGRSPLDGAALAAEMDRAVVGHAPAKAALDMALYDLAAQAAGMPLHAFLGGRLRDGLPLSYSVSLQDLDRERDVVRARSEDGIAIFKVKVGLLPWRVDSARLAQVRELVPDATLRCDYNAVGNLGDVLRLLDAARELDLDFAEQPFPDYRGTAHRRVRERCAVRLSVDEGCRGSADVADLAGRHAADVVSVKIGKVGGIRKAVEIAHVAAATGIEVYAGGLSETRLGFTAALHAFVAMPGVVPGCDFYFARHILASDDVVGGCRLDGGFAALPDGPGLGASLPDEWFGA